MSTALMYSFGQREDTSIVDEPLYAHYLRVSGADHPGRERVLRHQESDGDEVVRTVILGTGHTAILFFKNMAHHLVDLDWNFLSETVNIILTRDPKDVLPSLSRKLSNIGLEDTGYAIQAKLLEWLEARGVRVPVIDARQLLENPESILRQLCRRIDIPFDGAMLHWPEGPRNEDGIWADIWYHDVHTTTGFAPYRPRATPFPDELLALLKECEPFYEQLRDHAITASE